MNWVYAGIVVLIIVISLALNERKIATSCDNIGAAKIGFEYYDCKPRSK
jgi:hypothetical protein